MKESWKQKSWRRTIGTHSHRSAIISIQSAIYIYQIPMKITRRVLVLIPVAHVGMTSGHCPLFHFDKRIAGKSGTRIGATDVITSM